MTQTKRPPAIPERFTFFGGIIHSEVAFLLLLRTVGLMKMLEADRDQFILHFG